MHTDGGWSEGIVGWEEKGAPVLSAFVGGFRRASEDVVPFKNVAFGGVSDDVGWGILLDCLIFAGQL